MGMGFVGWKRKQRQKRLKANSEKRLEENQKGASVAAGPGASLGIKM
jgi:hypothetical protein